MLLAKSIDYLTWSRSGEYIHFFDFVEDGTPFYRVRVSDHKLERKRIGAVSLPRGMVKGQFGQWTGLAPDDSPLLVNYLYLTLPRCAASKYDKNSRDRFALEK